MAKITFYGMEEYMTKLERLEESSEDLAKKALHEGAGILADEVRANLENLPTDECWGTQAEPVKGIRKIQKKGLIESFGVAPIRNDNGYFHTHVGFDGYNSVKTKKHPKGQPNQMIARIAESGTSFSRKTPFVARAVRKARDPAKAKMKEVFENGIDEIMKE